MVSSSRNQTQSPPPA